jgi:multiple antibiotic resistance protein
LLAGRFLLTHLGVTVPAFAISGGVLLFATALPMLFGQRGALQSPERGEAGQSGEDIAVFPLAIPLLSGPGTITTMLLLATQAGADLVRVVILIPMLGLVFLIAWMVLASADRLIERIGQGKIHIITRVLGIVLAALAVQYVLDGVRSYYQSLMSGADVTFGI